MIVAEFDVSYADGELTHSTLDGGIDLVGTPYHSDPGALITKYQHSVSEYCNYEVRESCGNYVLIDTTGSQLRAVTSPAFAGGYVLDTGDELHLTSTLDTALAKIDLAALTVNRNRLIHYISRDLEERSPFTTVFENVYRLPPGTVLSGDGTDWSLRSYLRTRNVSREFAEVRSDLCDAFADTEVVLCLSGGADSTAFALMLQEHDISFRTLTFDFGPGHGKAPEMSRRVTEEFGMEHEIVDSERPLSEANAVEVEHRMGRDIIKPHTPTHALDNVDLGSDDVLVYAQNADNFSKLKMKDQRNYGGVFSGSPTQIAGRWLRFLANLQYMSLYLEHKTVRDLYLRAAPALFGLTNELTARVIGDPFPGSKHNPAYFANSDSYGFSDSDYSIFDGLLSSSRPNIQREYLEFDTAELPADTLESLRSAYDRHHITEELRLFEAVNESDSNLGAAKRLMYFMNGHNAHNQQTTFATDGCRVEVPIAWGPSISYFFSNDHTWERAMFPKREIYEYVESRLGEPYAEFMSGIEIPGWTTPQGSPLLESNSHLFEPDQSMLLNDVAGVPTAALTDLYSFVADRVAAGQFTSIAGIQMPARILNLELLLRNTYDR
jgi:hypothetical protein